MSRLQYELVFSVWIDDDPISGIVQFSPDTFNEFGGIGMTARIACRNQVITNTINAVAPMTQSHMMVVHARKNEGSKRDTPLIHFSPAPLLTPFPK